MNTHTATAPHEQTSNDILRGGSVFAGVIALLALALLLLFWVAAALGLDPELAKWGQALTVIGAALAVFAVILGTWRDWRYVLVEPVAAFISRNNADVRRSDAESERILSEAAAIKLSAERASQINVNSGSGNQIVKNKAITYRVAGNLVAGNQLTVNQNAPRTIKLEAADIRWFAEQLAVGYGHSKSKWVNGTELPYSRTPVTYDIYKALIDAIVDAGGIIGRGERASGTLIEHAPKQLIKMIDASYPEASSKGITLEFSGDSEQKKPD